MKEQNEREDELDIALSTLIDDQSERWPAAIRRLGGERRETADAPPGAPAEKDMPADVDRRVSRALENAVAASAKRKPAVADMQHAHAAANALRAWRWAGLVAAAIFLAMVPVLYFNSGSEHKFTVLSRTGEILMNGRADFRANRAPAKTTRLELKEKSLLYAALGKDMRLRITGPALLRYEKRGDAHEIFLERGRLDIRSGGAGIKGFAVLTARSRIELRGTMFAVSADSEGESTRLLEGRLRIKDERGVARDLKQGEKLRVGADGRREIAPLSPADARELARIDGALAAAKPTGESGKPAPGRENALGSLEDIRALYGFVSKYELADGRRLKGHLVTREGRSYVHTVKGLIPIRQSDIRSMNLIE